MDTFSDRLRTARLAAGYGVKAHVARLLGISPSAYGRYELPVTHENWIRPKGDNLARLALLFDVHHEWLFSGRGPMRYNADVAALPQSVHTTVTRLLALPAAQQALVTALIDNLAESSTDRD